jgi:hypothetical protein
MFLKLREQEVQNLSFKKRFQKLPGKDRPLEENEQDWRGLIALLIIIGSFVLIGLAMVTNKLEYLGGGLWTLLYAVANWYYTAKSEKEKQTERSE